MLLTQYMKFLKDQPDVWPYLKESFPLGIFIEEWIWMAVDGVVEVCVEEVADDELDKLLEDAESTDNAEAPQPRDAEHTRIKSESVLDQDKNKITSIDKTMESELHWKRKSEAFIQNLKDEINLDQIYQDAYNNDDTVATHQAWDLDRFFWEETSSSSSSGPEIMPEIEFNL